MLWDTRTYFYLLYCNCLSNLLSLLLFFPLSGNHSSTLILCCQPPPIPHISIPVKLHFFFFNVWCSWGQVCHVEQPACCKRDKSPTHWFPSVSHSRWGLGKHSIHTLQKQKPRKELCEHVSLRGCCSLSCLAFSALSAPQGSFAQSVLL